MSESRQEGYSNQCYVFGSLLCNRTVCLMCFCVSTDCIVCIFWDGLVFWGILDAVATVRVRMIAWKLRLQLWLLASEYTGGGEGGCWVIPLKIKIQLILGDSCVEGKVWKLSTGLVSPEEIMICYLLKSTVCCIAIVRSNLALFYSICH